MYTPYATLVDKIGIFSTSPAKSLLTAFLAFINALVTPVPIREALVPTAKSLAPFLKIACTLCISEYDVPAKAIWKALSGQL
uniref:Uncharacterized protein n=1 Tax=Arundo donax TaxID=35708 RepID=A0A0A9ETV8_ARUDO